jgi:hypothetical protein
MAIPIFLVGDEYTLKVIHADEFGDELCAAIDNGLAKFDAGGLILDGMVPSDGDGAISARNALSFAPTPLSSL